jgi:ABC-type multidrug transport system fused ATPase/permease subunit
MRRSQKFEKPKNRKGTLIQLGGYLMRYKWRLFLAIVLTIGSNLLALVGPLLSGYAIDAIEFLLAGATAIQVGTANFIDPQVCIKIIEGIEAYCSRHGVKEVKELIGALES